MVLMIAFTMMAGLFADVKLLPKDKFNHIVFEQSYIQPLIAYVADTWEDIYEKTGVDKYGWKEGRSMYCNCTGRQLLLIVKCDVKGSLWWICLEYPGDGSLVLHYAYAEY